MVDNKQEVLDGLREAMQTEVDGYEFYTLAADRTEDEMGAEAFRILASEEQKHLMFLREQYRAIDAEGHASTSLDICGQHEFEGDMIFSKKILDNIGDAQFEMSALSIGIKLELSSIDYYKAQAEKVDDPDLKAFYNDLVNWETHHYDILNRQHEILKEEFWAKGGFAPF